MRTAAAGSVFWALLSLFPVTVESSSNQCVTYKHRAICGLRGSSVDFPCSFPQNDKVISMTGWSKKYNTSKKLRPLKQISSYSSRMALSESGRSDCTLKLRDLKKSDEAMYYFVYSIRNASGYRFTCHGDPGVRLRVFDSAVSIFVWKQNSWMVMEGQSIILTCVPTCVTSLNSNPGYIWYKNKQQLNDSRARSLFLSLDQVSTEDSGGYVCAMLGYEDLPSTAVHLMVQGRQSSTVTPTITSTQGAKPTLKHGCATQKSKNQTSNSDQTAESKGMGRIFIILAASVSIGFLIGITVTILLFKRKQRMKRMRRQSACSVHKPLDPNSDVYMSLEISSLSPEYETLNAVKCSSTGDSIYENLHNPGEQKSVEVTEVLK